MKVENERIAISLRLVHVTNFLFLGTNIGNIPIVAQGTRKRRQEETPGKLVGRNISKKKYPDVSNSICFSYPMKIHGTDIFTNVSIKINHRCR